MRTAIALCFLALTLAACGAAPKDSAEDFKGDQRNVANTVEDLEAAARKSDGDKVCAQLLAPSLLDTLKKQGTNCTTAVKEAFKDADSVRPHGRRRDDRRSQGDRQGDLRHRLEQDERHARAREGRRRLADRRARR